MVLKRPLLVALLLSGGATVAFAAPAAPPRAASPVAPSARPASPSSPIDAVVEEAQDSAAKGYLAHALSVLEPYAKDPRLSPQGKATLGFLYVETGKSG